ncbi:MAG: aldo/keto reductase [Corynebacterium sp.]|nr:aldo/keto reductase [Corynebacterium sp.]
MKNVTLANGVEIPVLGFGVYQIPPAQTQRAVEEAFEIGYRHIDTAAIYGNEAEVGAAIKASGLKREEIFITTKLWLSEYDGEKAARAIDTSMEKLGLDTVDLFLLHQPFNDTYNAWRALEKAYSEKKLRAIGISNFSPDRAVDLGTFNDLMPMINQIETNPLHQRRAEGAALTSRGIVHEAWAPFGEGRNGIFTNPVLQKIGDAHGKSVAQVILRWLIEQDIVALAKSVHKERMAENFDIFDFELTDDDHAAIAALDKGASLFFSHQTPETVEFMAKVHSN